MLRILIHVALVAVVLWHQRHGGYRRHPFMLAVLWYAAGVPFMLLESLFVSGRMLTGVLLQNMLVALFFVPPAWVAFAHARKTRRGILRPFLLYVGLALVATLVAGLVLARADSVRGLTSY